jgi:hypothetical protein
MRLRDQQIGMQFANQFPVNVIQRLARPQTTPDFRINLPTRNSDIKRRTAAGGKASHPIRVIALVRTSCQHFPSAQGAA